MPNAKTVEKKLDYWIAESIKDKKFEDVFEIESELSR